MQYGNGKTSSGTTTQAYKPFGQKYTDIFVLPKTWNFTLSVTNGITARFYGTATWYPQF